MPLCVSQVDFSQVCDSVRHGAVQRSMLRRGVAPPIVAAYLRNMRGNELVFVHDGWRTRPIHPSIGLRQGCSLSPVVFRWVMEDTIDAAREEWSRLGLGVSFGEHVLTCLAWADDTRLFAAIAQGLKTMVGILNNIAWRTAGLQLQPDKCTWAHPGGSSTGRRPGTGYSTPSRNHKGGGRGVPQGSRGVRPVRWRTCDRAPKHPRSCIGQLPLKTPTMAGQRLVDAHVAGTHLSVYPCLA